MAPKNHQVYEPLHPLDCNETESDFRYMYARVQEDRRSLARHQRADLSTQFTCPPLMAAYYTQHYRCMLFLLLNGAKPEGKSRDNFTTMHICLHNKDVTATTLLLDYGFDLTCKGNLRGSYLSWSLGNAQITCLLLKHGAEIDCLHQITETNAFVVSHLTQALRKGYFACAKLLLLFGAKTDYRLIPNIPEATANINAFAHNVIEQNNMSKPVHTLQKMFVMLREFGVDLNQRNALGVTVLYLLQLNSEINLPSNQLAVSLEKLLKTPMSLKSISRIAVRKAMGNNVCEKVNTLKNRYMIPLTLHSFLNYTGY